MKKILLGGLVVLLALFVVGCGMSSGDEDVSGSKYDKTWEKENNTVNYLRFYEQFGTSKKVTYAKVKMTISNPEKSRAGLIFGMNKNAEDSDLVDYFILGVGSFDSLDGPGYYLDYHKGVDPEVLSAASGAENLDASDVTSIKATAAFDTAQAPVMGSDGSMTVYASVDIDEDGKFTVSLGATKDNLPVIVANGLALSTYDTDADPAAPGGIGCYGMVFPGDTGTGTATKTTNRYTVVDSKPAPTSLSAE
ncbi:MAG: hypothetical protein J6B32_01890 [Spirochaetaceae bacterium]|nr:hypothetical protein [Treponema sp.]MBO5235851.1 hypothetical protein [Spirochaetaceae bacterium]